MSRSVQTTIDWLATTENEAAVRVLVGALDSDYREIRDRALGAVLQRRGLVGHREIVRRLHRFDQAAQQAVRDNGRLMSQAVRDAVLDADAQVCRNGCRVALWFLEYDLIPTLLNALADRTNPNAPTLLKTLQELVYALYGELTAPVDPRRRRDPQMICDHVLTAVESSVAQYLQHKRVEIVEAFLILARRDNETFRNIVGDPYHPAFLTVLDILAKSPHEGVIRLLLSCLDDMTACSAVLSVIGNRYDLPFLRQVLKKIGWAPSQSVARNLRRIESIPWLNNPVPILSELNGPEQAAAIQFAVGSRVPRRQAFSLIQFLLLYGKTDSRRVASVALEEFTGVEANELAVAALSDDDPLVQANIVRQLRARSIPGILNQVLDLADSPHPEVQQAVRESLDEFRIDRYLMMFDTLEPDVRLRTGKLVRKLDSQTISRLREELVSGLRTHRLRALQAIDTIGAMDVMEREVINVLRHDEDHLVRIKAIDVLAEWGTRDAFKAIHRAIKDPSPAVVGAAQRAVEDWKDLPPSSMTGDDDGMPFSENPIFEF
ncbi:MAG: HEAT repeat domain-containing protein [Pirellulales bacterium]|nr:HEAT repeat domain-containing protein [Pirellulales bacterium]